MSAWDIAGAVAWMALAFTFYWGATIPAKPPKPPYGAGEAICLLLAIGFLAAAVFCIARMFGAHA